MKGQKSQFRPDSIFTELYSILIGPKLKGLTSRMSEYKNILKNDPTDKQIHIAAFSQAVLDEGCWKLDALIWLAEGTDLTLEARVDSLNLATLRWADVPLTDDDCKLLPRADCSLVSWLLLLCDIGELWQQKGKTSADIREMWNAGEWPVSSKEQLRGWLKRPDMYYRLFHEYVSEGWT